MAPRSRPAIQRFLPLGYFGAAVLLVALLLPTALRPPQDTQNTSTEFSPDAPPDDSPPEAILQSLRRAQSSTAGGGEEVGVPPEAALAGEESASSEPPPAPPLAIKKPAKGRCVGNPPRQAESPYSPPCAPAFQGDNGGATARHVRPTEVRIGIPIGVDSRAPEGPIPAQPQPGEEAVVRESRVWQAYFNERFELYGRQIRLYLIKVSLDNGPQGRAAMQKADEDYDVFAVCCIQINTPAVEEAVRRQIIVFGGQQNPTEYFARHHPYLFSFFMDANRVDRFIGEFVCKQLAGKPPTFNETQDPTFDYKKPRKFGLLLYSDETRFGNELRINRELSKCGERLPDSAIHKFNLYDNKQAVAGVITRLRADGVTSVICFCDAVSPIVYTGEAQNQKYFPEWITPGTGGMETHAWARLYDQSQWRHALGVHHQEISRPAPEQEWYRAYKEIAPDDRPGGDGTFRDGLFIAGGIQMAGPRLTPDTFWEGLSRFPIRPPDPIWSVGGGFARPDDFTYSDYVSLVWYDAAATERGSTAKGSYRHLMGGRRFAYGELPTDNLGWFADGIVNPDPPG